MTVDLDLLADYIEGVLEPDEQARVESLVQDDRDWATALGALRTALPSVTAALASVESEPMPASVLTAALQAFAAERATGVPAATSAHERDATRPASGCPPTTNNTKRVRRREARIAMLSAFALVLVVAVGLGFVIRTNTTGSHDSATTSGAKAAPQIASGAASESAGVIIVATGTDYTRIMFPTLFGSTRPLAGISHGRTPDSVPRPQLTPAGLGRLESPDALNECLAEVGDAVGGRPAVVDYARFQGTPALIMAITNPKVVIAVGADCGLTGHGIDELARS